MIATYSLDILNSEDWDNSQWNAFVRDRLVKMRTKREWMMRNFWNEAEVNVNSISVYDNYGNLNVQVPLEKTLGEIYMGRTNGKIDFEILPDWQANTEELQPTKFAMQFFLDGNHKDTFWRENKHMRETKWQKGSGIFYTGIRSYRDHRFKVKEDANIETDTDLLDKRNLERYMSETWFFFPKSIDVNDFYIDDNACGQPDVQYADDCIYKEKVSAQYFHDKFCNNKTFINTDNITYFNDINPKNKDDTSTDIRHIVLYHYFNRIRKTYIILANETYIIYNGLYLYDDGKLPFVNIQHFSNQNRFWGEWIPERIQYLKFYKSEILQDILQGAWMNNALHLVAGNDELIGQDWQVWWRGINIWRTVWWAESVRPINTSINLAYLTQCLQVIDKQIIQDSGINPLSQIESQAPTLWQEELIEANKAVRNSSLDENYNIGIDEAMTMMLSRIQQFAPALLKTTIKGKDWQILKTIFPKIRIDNKAVKEKRNSIELTEAIWKYWYFELKPWVVQWVGVKISTSSTKSTLPVIERQKINEFLKNIISIANIANLDQTWGSIKKLIDYVKFEDLMDWISDAYWYDKNSLHANTEKDKITQENKNMLNRLRSLLTLWNTNENSQWWDTGTQGQSSEVGGQQQQQQQQPWNAEQNNPWTTEINTAMR